jgi:hypothetical protein
MRASTWRTTDAGDRVKRSADATPTRWRRAFAREGKMEKERGEWTAGRR